MEKSELKAIVLRKMLMHRWIGGKHTAIDNIPKGVSASYKERYFNGYK